MIVRAFSDFLSVFALVGALAVVYFVDRLTDGPRLTDDQPTEEQVIPPNRQRSKGLRLAVTPAEFDDMGRLLERLGNGYEYSEISLEDLLLKQAYADYDVVFLTCGTDPESWLGNEITGGERSSTVRALRPQVVQTLHDNLRFFVRNGGTLYASDWRFNIVKVAFPELVQQIEGGAGAAQEVRAEVVDDDLRDILGPYMSLPFDLGAWYPATFRRNGLKTYLIGTFMNMAGTRVTQPLLVRVPFGKGHIVFTSFHNEKRNSENELELLRYLVFITVTARADAAATEMLRQGGFLPQKRNLLSASNENSITKTFLCETSCQLQFVLAFEDKRARFRLTVVSPDGHTLTRDENSTVAIDVADGPAGQWTYTVTTLAVPYENFPFTVTVGTK